MAPRIHRLTSDTKALVVNIYLVEGEAGVVLVDGAISGGFGDTVRAYARDEIGKPLIGAILTHGHPDHVLGLGHILDDDTLPIYGLAGAVEQARKRETSDLPAMRQAFGADFPAPYRRPDHLVATNQTVDLGDLSFLVREYGPGESDCDATWALRGTDALFCGDLVYNHMHLFLRDGHGKDWLASLDRLAGETDRSTRLHPGHGDICGHEAIDWTRDYLHMARHTAGEIAKDGKTGEEARRMFLAAINDFLPHGELLALASYELDDTIAAIVADIN